MNYFKGLVSNVKGFYDGINAATLTGAIDVIVVRQEDGSLVGGPFHVRFGKLGVLRAKEKVVDISVNDKDIDVHMKLGDAGEAFFVQECPEEVVPSELATSPIPSSEMLMHIGIKELHRSGISQGEKEMFESNENAAEEVFQAELVSVVVENAVGCETLESTVSEMSDQKLRKQSQEETEIVQSNSLLRTSSDYNAQRQQSPVKKLRKRATSSSIPIPKGSLQTRWTSSKNLSDSDDPLSVPGSDSPEVMLRDNNEYPLSDMDMPVASSVIMSSITKEHSIDPRRVLSDTEVELSAMQLDSRQKTNEVTWEWGELPQGPTKVERTAQQESIRKRRSEKNSKPKVKLTEGLYLDDVLQADQEVAALYLNRQRTGTDGDFDSGIGQDSKPVSPTKTGIEIELQSKSVAVRNGMPNKIAISVCGDLKRGKVDSEKFRKALVSYDDFCKNPSILNDPNLVVKMDRRYYNWHVAAPYIMSMILFQKPLCKDTMKSLKQQHMPRKRKGWFTWRTSNDEADSSDEDENNSKRVERHYRTRGSKSEPDRQMDGDPKVKVKDRYKKVTRLSSDQWQTLGLDEGTNDITFSVTTQYQGTASCSARIFLWNYYDRIVISDIDGTITRSDVFGQILPLVGKDWSQNGVTGLFTNIERNDFRFMYLSARAIGQAQITRDFLKSVRQGEETLPDGPVLLSPTSLIKAFQREVIEKKPEIFKIACMRDIRNIFPSTRNPFYSGFGNRVNDVWAYRALGIPISRIFTINYKGEIKHELTNAFSSSYEKLVNLVDQMFPPLTNQSADSVSAEFSTFTYWKTPFPEIVNSLDPVSDDENVGL